MGYKLMLKSIRQSRGINQKEASGADIKTVASNLGHANAAMTLNIYASADPDAKRRAASIMDGAI